MKTDLNSVSDAGSAEARRQRVVTLVHGTWAKDASWVRADSKICMRLRQLDPSVVIRTFQWSGRNSHRARLHAAEALAKQLGETFSEHPEAEHHLIGHSHGGNVALYVLRDPRVCGRIASIVCLATPFIHAEVRPVEPAMLVLRLLIYSITFAPAVLAFFAVLFTTWAVLFFPESELAALMSSAGLPTPLMLVGMVVLCGLFIRAGWQIARGLRRWIDSQLRPRIESYQRKLVKEYEHHTLRPVPILNAQVERDEAALWLRALRWASEPRGDSRVVILLAAVFALVLGGFLFWAWIQDGHLTESLFSFALSLALVTVATLSVWMVMLALGFVMSHFIFIMVPLLIRAHGGGFGEWSLIANWLAVIDARAEPAGGFQLESFRIAGAGKGLRHSQIYEDERVIERICKWLEHRPWE